MDKTIKGRSSLEITRPTRLEITPDSGSPGPGSQAASIPGAWIREDGAICFGDECVVIHESEQGELNIDVNPSACGAETGKIVVGKLMDNFTSGKPLNVRVVPGKDTK